MRFEASYIDSHFAHALAGGSNRLGIHSVFEKAINIEINGKLFAVVCSDRPRYNAASIDPCPFYGFKDLLISPQGLCTYRDGVLYIHATDLEIVLSFAEKVISPYNPGMYAHLVSESGFLRKIGKNIEYILSYLVQETVETINGYIWQFLDSLLGSGAKTKRDPKKEFFNLSLLEKVIKNSESRRVEGILSALREFIGQGIGLTPTGDDFLTGFFSVCSLFDIRTFMKEIILEDFRSLCMERTNMISRTFIENAIEGNTPWRIGKFIEGLTGSDKEILKDSVDRLLTFGSTSGGDSALGVILGMHCLGSGNYYRGSNTESIQ
jgi:hypothetical protein